MKLLFSLAQELAPYVLAAALAYVSLRSEKTASLSKLACVAPLVVILYLRLFLVRINIPEHLLNHSYGVDTEFLDANTVRRLMELTRLHELPSNNRDTQFYTREVEHEDIGEVTPLTPKGDCSQHMLLVPNTNKSGCVLPSRIDVARHFIISGGVGGNKERVQMGISRLLSFGRYMFNLTDYPVAKQLFESPKFAKAALEICPADKQFLDPVQFNFIVQVPGQSVVRRSGRECFCHGPHRCVEACC
jgi:hypothetical protein